MGDSPSSDSGSNNESRMSPGRATAQFGSEVGSLAGGYTESQVQDAIDQNESSDSPRTNVEIARDARVPGTFTQQSQNYVDDFSGANRGSLPTSRGTSTAALPSSFPTDFTRDYSDFTTADQLRSMSNSINNPLSNVLTRLGLPTTQNRINQGYTPIYTGPKGNQQITGTMNYGIGMGMPTNDLNMTGSGSDVPGYNRFAPVTPTTNVPMDMGDDGGGNEQTLIRRNPNDPVDEIVEETPPVSDQLATDFLQNPYYLYSGIGNQYQPYGYAQGTLVDLLRTRNLTQPQQAAANLGLFGNPGDFS